MNTNEKKNVSILATFIATILQAIKSFQPLTDFYTQLYRIGQILNQLKTYAIMQAYYIWSNKSLLFSGHQMAITRSGIADMRFVIYIIVAFLIAAILFPIAMQQVTSAVTTSWGAGVAPVFVSLLPILVIVAIALHFFGGI